MTNTLKSQPDALAPKRVTRPKRKISPVRGRAALKKSIELHGSGATGLAKTLKKKYGAVAQWVRKGSVPAEYAPVIEVMGGRQVKADDLCPSVPWHLIRASQDAEVARLTVMNAELLKACRDAVEAGCDGDWQSAERGLRAIIARATP